MASTSPLLHSSALDSDRSDAAFTYSPATAASSLSSSRQTRRLRLRNAGFRGAAMTTNVENIEPESTTKRSSAEYESPGKSGVLQDIGNSATTKRTRPFDTAVWTPKSSRKLSTRPGSAETRKYVDHLEQQLLEAHEQLSSLTSPSVGREQSSRLRHLNAETRRLQDEVARWESKYEERVLEELDQHFQLESSLRARIRNLETEAGNSRSQSEEMQMRMDIVQQNLAASEAANVNLEKRLEVLSELLAASPNKIDLHADSSPRRALHARHGSIIPRFPTAGSLAASPERSAHVQPMSPSNPAPSPTSQFSPSNLCFSPDIPSSDGEEERDSISSAVPRPASRTRPQRRMRRFGAGSLGPKPLILPSTSHCDPVTLPASAPPLDRPPPFHFPSRSVDTDLLSFSSSPRHPHVPPSRSSPPTTLRTFSPSVGRGRNLLEELATFESSEGSSSEVEAGSSPRQDRPRLLEPAPDLVHFSSSMSGPSVQLDIATSAHGFLHPPSLHARSRSRSSSLGALDSLRASFAHLLRSPVHLAHHLIRSVHIHSPLSAARLHYWFLGVLFGPMARNRLRAERRAQPCLLDDEPAHDPLPSARLRSRNKNPRFWKHSPFLWLKFGFTLAVAVGLAVREGPGRLLLSDIDREAQRNSPAARQTRRGRSPVRPVGEETESS